MAISWITALKLVPWGDVIEATPQVLKAAKSLLRKKEETPADAAASTPSVTGAAGIPPPRDAGEQALQLIQAQEARIQQLERAGQQSAELIEQLAEQNAQIIQTVDLLRIGAQRLFRACAVLAVVVAGLGIALWRLT